MDPNFAKFLDDRYFHGKKNGIAIECGALDGIYLSQTYYFEENYNWKCYNIEASKRNFDKLVINRPNAVNVNYALMDKCGFCRMWRRPANSKNDKVFSDVYSKIEDIPTKEHKDLSFAETTTYKILIDKWKLKELDLFVLDVEEQEENVLNGMKGSSILPRIFVIEICRTDKDGKSNNRHELILKALYRLERKYEEDHVSGFNTFFVRQD